MYTFIATFLSNLNIQYFRNHYICSVYAAKFMVPRKNGLIVNLSSAGGLRYLFNVAYGVGKEAVSSYLFAFVKW